MIVTSDYQFFYDKEDNQWYGYEYDKKNDYLDFYCVEEPLGADTLEVTDKDLLGVIASRNGVWDIQDSDRDPFLAAVEAGYLRMQEQEEAAEEYDDEEYDDEEYDDEEEEYDDEDDRRTWINENMISTPQKLDDFIENHNSSEEIVEAFRGNILNWGTCCELLDIYNDSVKKVSEEARAKEDAIGNKKKILQKALIQEMENNGSDSITSANHLVQKVNYNHISSRQKTDLLNHFKRIIAERIPEFPSWITLSIDDKTALNELSGNDICRSLIGKELEIYTFSSVVVSDLNDGEDKVLFEKLKDLRHCLAIDRNVPFYSVGKDSSLHDMATKKPTTLEDLGSIQEFGQTRIANYGTIFIEFINSYLSNGI